MSFAALVASARRSADGFTLAIPADWHQGRTAYGGLSTALAYVAACQIAGDLPPLRSAQVSMIGPLAGEVAVMARVLRRGRNATWIGAEIFGAAGIGLAATFVFMGATASALTLADLPPPADLITLDEARPFTPSHGPAFRLAHLDVRFARPRAEDKAAEICWWVRLRDRAELEPMTEALLIADALPPGVMPLLAPGVPVSTTQWQVNVLEAAPQAYPGGWWLLRSLGEHAAVGGASQRMALWGAGGQAVIAGTQAIALFG